MKHIKHFNNYISESIATPILYHFTRTDKLSNILKNNTLNLTHNLGSKSDEYGNKIYYMSFTRTKSTKSGYGTKFKNSDAVRITFDGTKLNNNYKFLPIDYWKYPKTPDFMNNLNGDETEDRLVSDKESIPNANKYIKKIDVFIDNDGIQQSIIDNCKKLNIQIYFYDNLNDFETGNTVKSIVPNIDNDIENNSVYEDKMDYDLVGLLSFNNPNIIPILKDKIPNLDIETIEEYHNKLKRDLKYDSLFDNIRIQISHALSNEKRNTNPIRRFIIFEIGKEYKKLGAKSVGDYLTKKMNIGKKSQQDFNKEFYNNINNFIDNKVKEYISKYKIYGVINGEEVDNLLETDEFIQDYIKIINDFKNYIKEYVLNNNDMFRYYYLISRTEMKEVFNTNELIKNLKDKYDADDNTDGLINYLLYDLDDFIYEEKNRLQEENHKQWYK